MWLREQTALQVEGMELQDEQVAERCWRLNRDSVSGGPFSLQDRLKA